MIALVCNQKGGVGKSTTACNLAAIRAGQGRRVMLVDTDGKNRSASQWADYRKATSAVPLEYAFIEDGTLPEKISAFALEFDDIVIDAGGRDSPSMRVGMLLANVIVTPVTPDQFAILSMFSMDEIVGAAKPFNPALTRVLCLVNEAPTNPAETDVKEMRAFLSGMVHYQFMKAELSVRKAFKLCARDGLAVTEYPKSEINPKAAAEMAAVAAEVWG